MRLLRISLILAVVLCFASQVKAQTIPPNAWHPFRGGKNCVQVADANGFFNCSPLVTIDPTTGVFQSQLGLGPITTVIGPLVIAPQALQPNLESVGNDLVIAKNTLTATAPTGPGPGAVTLRVRPSPRIPGYCQVVAIAGNAFGALYEFPIAFLNPSYPFSPTGSGVPLYSQYVVDLPGGPGGC